MQIVAVVILLLLLLLLLKELSVSVSQYDAVDYFRVNDDDVSENHWSSDTQCWSNGRYISKEYKYQYLQMNM